MAARSWWFPFAAILVCAASALAAGCGGECGDGKVRGDEACDDGNTADGDGCDAVCAVETGWRCNDDGCCQDECPLVDGTQCDASDPTSRYVYTCTAGALCNTLVETAECTIDDTGCEDTGLEPARCINIVCGDGFITAGEECDDADFGDGDGCSTICMVEPGWHCLGEASLCCPDQCTTAGETSCAPSGYAILSCETQFNGCNVLVTDEICMEGFICDDSGGAPVCQPCVSPICGDGLVCPAEACEDGNVADGDGCSAACGLEATCGNGAVEPGEECDDGNPTTGDGCDDACALEAGTVCGDAIDLSAPGVATESMGQTTYDGDTTASTFMDFGDPSCVFGAPTVGVEARLHRYLTGPAPSTLVLETIDVLSPLNDTVVWAYADCLDLSSEIACADDGGTGTYSRATTALLPPATSVYVVVAGASDTDVGPYELRITEVPYQVEPASGTCASPSFVTAGNYAGRTLASDTDALSSSCGGGGAPEAVYALDLFGSAINLTVSVETSDGALDLALYVLQGTCDGMEEVECANAFLDGGTETLTINNATAGLYYIVVDGNAAGNVGDYRLRITW